MMQRINYSVILSTESLILCTKDILNQIRGVASMPTYYHIDETLARRAKEMSS